MAYSYTGVPNLGNYQQLANQQQQGLQNQQYGGLIGQAMGGTIGYPFYTSTSATTGMDFVEVPNKPRKKRLIENLRSEIDEWHGDILRAA